MKKYNPKARVVEILNDPNIQFAIIQIIQERIYNKGILGEGTKLKTDSARYQSGQAAYSKRNPKRNRTHVDLYITGDFYDSWQLKIGRQVSVITSNEINKVFENFQDTFASPKDMLDKISTLTREEIDAISKELIMPIIENDLKELLNV